MSTFRMMYKGRILNGNSSSLEGAVSTGQMPVGSIVPYMGKTVPSGFLLCDGSEVSISEYGELANFILTEYGSMTYFGGDGQNTFCVPDLRDKFIRGFGPETGRLSGELGAFQLGTKINTFSSIAPGTINMAVDADGKSFVENADKYYDATQERLRVYSPYAVKSTISDKTSVHYTTRPDNVAVNFIIKAKDNFTGVYPNNYASDKPVIVGSINGVDLWRQIIHFNGPDKDTTSVYGYPEGMAWAKSVSVRLHRADNYNDVYLGAVFLSGDTPIIYNTFTNQRRVQIQRLCSDSTKTISWDGAEAIAVVEYCKKVPPNIY